MDVRIFYKEAKSLQRSGYDVTIIAPAVPSLKADSTIDGIRILIIPRYGKKILRPLTLFDLFRRGIAADADIYHCHEPDALIAGAALKIIRRKKLVYDAHEYWSHYFSEKFPKTAKKLAFLGFDIIEKTFCAFADYIITVSEETVDNYRRYNKRTTLVANFPDMEFFTGGEKPDLAERYSGKTIFVYAGGLEPNRGTLESIKALELVKDKNAVLLFVGPFKNSGYEKEVMAYVNEKNLTQRVEFVGNIPYKDISAYLRMSTAGLLPHQPIERYSKTPYSIKLFEYMGCGLPVIVSRLPELTKIVEGAGCGVLVDPTKPEDMAKAMTWVMENPAAAKALGKNGRKAVEEKYNWQNMEKRLLEVYGSLLIKRGV